MGWLLCGKRGMAWHGIGRETCRSRVDHDDDDDCGGFYSEWFCYEVGKLMSNDDISTYDGIKLVMVSQANSSGSSP